jgi:hypothetical protein
LNTGELNIKTADTQPLHDALPAGLVAQQPDQKQPVTVERIDYPSTASRDVADSGDVLLELDDLEPVRQARDDEFVLDLDLEEVTENEATSPFAETIQPQPYPAEAQWEATQPTDSFEATRTEEIVSTLYAQEAAEMNRDAFEPVEEVEVAEPEPQELERPGRVPASVPAGQITLEQLSPEAIDAIAKRAVEQLSEKVIQEIAWEVVPSLAELLIKRQLQQKESQSS